MKHAIIAGLLLLQSQPIAAQAGEANAQANTAAKQRLDERAREAVAVLQGRQPAAEVFAPIFLAQISPAMLQQVATQLTAVHGPLLGVETITPTGPSSADITLRFEKATGRGVLTIAPDAPHLVTGLVLQTFEVQGDNVAKVRGDLDDLPGTVNGWFGPLDGGEPLLSLNADEPLALGSTFKLYVLAALARAIDEGRHRWDQVVPLTVRSYPSGMTQDWPQGTPVTLQTLATLMLQISDNTATDQVIAVLGRERVEAEMRRTNPDAARSLPFLTTRELFVVKSDPALRARYAGADQAGRRRILSDIAGRRTEPSVVAAAFGGAPLAIDSIEWFASPASLKRLMQELDDPRFATARSLMTVNRNLDAATAAGWSFVGFKGGSEPGVLNLTWLLQNKAGRWHMLTVGWNNPAAPVDAVRLDALAKRLLALQRP